MSKKVALGMSGGVDSSLSAKLLLDQGYDVHGVYLAGLYPGPKQDLAIADASAVAAQLGISFEVLDLGERTQILHDYFFQTYAAGRTPNVCVICNAQIKFGFFFQHMLEQGYDAVATGHYARLYQWGGETFIRQAADLSKDQSYFLGLVDENVWPRVIFPLGEYHKKTDTRRLARDYHLPVADKKESMEVCFLQNQSVQEALSTKLPSQPGDIIWEKSDGTHEIVGKHHGLNFYTLGQRHGLEIMPTSTATPTYYVKRKDFANSTLIVTTKDGLATPELRLINATPRLLTQLQSDADVSTWLVRIRHHGALSPVRSIDTDGERLTVSLADSASSPAPGQFAVFYAPHPDLTDDSLLVMGAAEIAPSV